MNGIEVRILPNQESKVVATLRVPTTLVWAGTCWYRAYIKNGTRGVPTPLEPRWGGKVGCWDLIRVL